MSDPELDALLARVSRSSNRLRIAMGITAVLCVLIAAGIAADSSVWSGGWGWRIGAGVGVGFFAAVAVLLGYGAFWRQQRHIARLRRTLRDHPDTVRSIRVMVARAVPVASWIPDDGTTTQGLHVILDDNAGRNWVLPVSRADATAVVAALHRRCPQATTEPG